MRDNPVCRVTQRTREGDYRISIRFLNWHYHVHFNVPLLMYNILSAVLVNGDNSRQETQLQMKNK